MGTHALMQESVSFHRLGLVVIDEQHRFGVEQRAALIGKGAAPDVLLLTATPIPRSLALTLYGDLDVSTLRTVRRAGERSGPRSAPARQRDRVLEFVRAECGKRPSGVRRAAGDRGVGASRPAGRDHDAQSLAARWPELRVGLVHGRLKAEERDDVMRRFRAGRDPRAGGHDGHRGRASTCPNATIMVIEHPERFGLAQLHQLRGRIGRGRTRASAS